MSTKAEEITATKLENLVKRLGIDIRNEAFEDQTVKCIYITRKVCDMESFAVQVKQHGAVKTMHMLGQQFLESTRLLNGTLDEISDLEIKENFGMFLVFYRVSHNTLVTLVFCISRLEKMTK